MVADRDADGAEQVAADIRSHGGDAVAVGVDISVLEQVEAMVALAVRRFDRVDILHDSAGLTDAGRHALDRDIVTMDLDAWERSKVRDAARHDARLLLCSACDGRPRGRIDHKHRQ